MNHISEQQALEQPKPGIVVIDERPIFRSGLTAAVSVINNKAHVTEVRNVHSLDVSQDIGPVIALLGVDRLSASEIKERISELKHSNAYCKIILYDFAGPVDMLSKYFGLGVDGFLTRFFDYYELERCLKAVMTDKRYLSEDIMLSFFDNYGKLKTMKQTKLSKTENIVANHLIVGKNLSWIAKTLGRRYSTISTVKSNIYKKMGVSTIIELQRLLSDGY